MIKNRRAVLASDVVALAIEGRRIMEPEEPAEKRLVAELRRIEDDLDRFGMAGPAGLDLGVGGVGGRAAGIPHLGRDHARDGPDDLFHAPEAASRESGGFHRDQRKRLNENGTMANVPPSESATLV